MQFRKYIPAAAALAGVITLPAMGLAQEAAPADITPPNSEIGYIFTTFMFLVAGFLVMWMAAGFSMLEAGLVRQKNVTMQLTKNIALFSIAGIAYYLVGYNLMYPGDGNWTSQGYLGAFTPAVLEAVGLAGETPNLSYASVGSDFYFQMMFCATTASIVSGTLAERIKLWPFLLFVVLLTAFIYPIQASWKWGGGFLDARGFQDFAGSTVVHSVGGWAALTGALILGPRIGKYKNGRTVPMPGSNLTLATLGTFILWLGWFGFNGGSQLYMDTAANVADIGRIFANTNTAAAGGALAAMLLTQALYKKVDLTMVLNGALAGLVSITAEPLAPTLGYATLIGAVGGVIVVFAVPLLDKLRIDDVVGAIPVHLFAGIWGTLAVAFNTQIDATNEAGEPILDATGAAVSVSMGEQFWIQLSSLLIVGLFVVVVSGVIWFILKATMGIRVSAEDEITGLDTTELGMEAYPEFAKG